MDGGEYGGIVPGTKKPNRFGMTLPYDGYIAAAALLIEFVGGTVETAALSTAACNDDSGILWIVLVLSQSYSGHANVELALPSVVEDVPQIV